MYTIIDTKTNMFFIGKLEYTGRGTPQPMINGVTNNIWKAIKFNKKSNVLKAFESITKNPNLKVVELEIKVK